MQSVEGSWPRVPPIQCHLCVDERCQNIFGAGYATLKRLQADQQPKYKPFLSHVHGVLYQVSREDMRKLQKREGGYVLSEVEVRKLLWLMAMTLVLRPEQQYIIIWANLHEA